MRNLLFFLFGFAGAAFSVAGIDFNTSSVISLPSTANTTELASKT